MTILERIAKTKCDEIAQRTAQTPIDALRASAASSSRNSRAAFETALRGPAPAVIAEFKRRSPSRGSIAGAMSLNDVIEQYAANGAAALSILTDEPYFGGCDDDLRTARRLVSLPLLRKDFTLDEYQIHEAAALGADAILLIVAMLDQQTLGALLKAAGQIGVAALVEVHDEAELERALAVGATVIGVNNRDLRTFEVSLETSVRLAPRIPAHCLKIAESGIHTRDEARRLVDCGYNALLVGEALLRDGAPGAALRDLRS